MNNLTYTKHTKISLKTHPHFNEAWLQDRIAEEPSILGLGDLILLDRERRQVRAGRLDLLLADFDNDRRFEVELMLGKLDESHIIRCIEYWDIERRRYPGYEHCAVIIAEDITSRFINVLSLLSGNIPLVAIQLDALTVGENIILNFVKVLDLRQLRVDDTVESNIQPVNREYWQERGSTETVKIADELLNILNQKSTCQQELNYNRHYIGLTDGQRTTASIFFKPRKNYCHITVRTAWTEEDLAIFEEVLMRLMD